MKKQFEDIPVWKNAFTLVQGLGVIFYHLDFRNYGFQDQIMRAAISITNNIAEGNDIGSAKDYARFFQISKGSCAEVRNMLHIAYVSNFISDNQKSELMEQSISISQQLAKLISYLRSKV